MLFIEFIAIGTWGFWGLLAIIAILLSEMLDTDRPAAATIMALATAVGLWLLGFHPWDWIVAHPADLALYAAGYLAAGSAWSMTKWTLWLLKIRRYIEELKRVGHPSIKQALWQRGYPDKLPPPVGEHKSKIMGWMCLWPASMLWTVINDPVKRAFEHIYNMLGGVYQMISNKVFAGVTIKE